VDKIPKAGVITSSASRLFGKLNEMLKANIEIKLNDKGDRWYVEACSANIDNTDLHPMPSGELFGTKDLAITEMKRRVMEWFKEKGRMETEDKIKWRVP
jgi:hypothetical protein